MRAPDGPFFWTPHGVHVSEAPFRGEARALGEYWRLTQDPVYRGQGVPRGDGRIVGLLPGLFANDLYLHPLRSWLRRLGYHPLTSRLPINAGCADRLTARVRAAWQDELAGHPGEIALVGHSRGGMLAKALLADLGGRCTRFIALGSPLGAILRGRKPALETLVGGGDGTQNPFARRRVVAAGRAALRLIDPDCEMPRCGCRYIDALLAPWPAGMQVTAIYSRDDPVVDPAACPIDGAENIEVSGSHAGLVVNREVYRHLAEALAR